MKEFTSSKLPTDLIMKYALQFDSAKKYIPAEKHTIVLNFSRYWYHGAEAKSSKRFSPFKNSLSEQFGLINYEITETHYFLKFIYKAILARSNSPEKSLFISHPSLYKIQADEGESLSPSLENVAIRIPQEKYDLVLMGDLLVYEDRKQIRKEYIVKGISMLNKTSHYGEKEVKAAIIARVKNNTKTGGPDTAMESFFTTGDRSLAEGAPREVYAGSVITSELAEELNELYVVKNPAEAISYLDRWSYFLTTQMAEADENSMKGYPIERPEFFIVSPMDRKMAGDKEVIYMTRDTAWVESSVKDYRSRLIVRVVHPVDARLFEKDPEYVRRFNELTALDVRIIDPAKKLEERGEVLTFKEKEHMHRMEAVGQERIEPALAPDPLPDELTRPAKTKRNNGMRKIKKEFEKNIKNEVRQRTEEYLSAEEIQSQIDQFINESSEAIAQAAEEERKNRADSMSDEGLSWKEAYDSVPMEECVEKVTADLRKKKSDELSETVKETYTKEAIVKFSPERKEKEAVVTQEYNSAIAEAESKVDRRTLTVYFEILLPPGTSVYEEYNERVRYFSKSAQYKLVCDQAGQQAVIARQMDALESFKNGEVANPYLASYLFSTDNAKIGEAPRINHFFGKNFNELQKRAVEEAVYSDGLYLIQGPPGTGKTQVISEITTQELLRGRKVLICSQNNKAIDNAFERLIKNPLIRPVRLMAEGRSSDYDLDELASNFYKNTKEILAERIELYKDPARMQMIIAEFDRIEGLREDYLKAKEKAQETITEVEKYRENLTAQNQKLVDASRRNDEKHSRIFLDKKLILGLDDFELSTYKKYGESIKDLFRESVVLTTKSKKRDGESELEGRLFGRSGLCCALMSLSDEKFNEQMNLMNSNTLYVDLYVRKCSAREDSDRAALDIQLDELVEKESLEPEDFVLLQKFGSDMDARLLSELPQIRHKLNFFREAAKGRLERDIATCEAIVESKIDEEKSAKMIALIDKKISGLESKPEYQKYLEAEASFSAPMQEMFNELHLSEKFTDVDSAYETLENNVKTLSDLNEEEIALSDRTYQEIIEFLESEKPSKKDSERMVQELRNYVNVVGITCTAEGRTKYDPNDEEQKSYLDATTMGIDVVIIDEVSKVPFTELLRPILSGKSIIMVGDHKQLPPMYNVKYKNSPGVKDEALIEREDMFKNLYTQPIFKSLFDTAPEHSKIMLRKQYRMASQIMDVINRFYNNNLEMGYEGQDAAKAHRITVPVNEKNIIDRSNSVYFINCKGRDIIQQGSMSFENAAEANAVARLVELLERNCSTDASGNPVEDADQSAKMTMGVITPYRAQARLIKSKTDRLYENMRRSGIYSKFKTVGEERFAVKSVDDFQGDERDIIILSLVRTKSSSFISDFRRINVAMSRARRLLILVGNEESLINETIDLDGNGDVHQVYKEIIDKIKEDGGYLEASELTEAE